MNESTFIDKFFFGFDLFLSHSFSLLTAFLSSKPFQNNQMHCEIIDATSIHLLLKYNWKRKLEVFFGQQFGLSNWYTTLRASLTAWYVLSIHNRLRSARNDWILSSFTWIFLSNIFLAQNCHLYSSLCWLMIFS